MACPSAQVPAWAPTFFTALPRCTRPLRSPEPILAIGALQIGQTVNFPRWARPVLSKNTNYPYGCLCDRERRARSDLGADQDSIWRMKCHLTYPSRRDKMRGSFAQISHSYGEASTLGISMPRSRQSRAANAAIRKNESNEGTMSKDAGVRKRRPRYGRSRPTRLRESWQCCQANLRIFRYSRKVPSRGFNRSWPCLSAFWRTSANQSPRIPKFCEKPPPVHPRSWSSASSTICFVFTPNGPVADHRS